MLTDYRQVNAAAYRGHTRPFRLAFCVATCAQAGALTYLGWPTSPPLSPRDDVDLALLAALFLVPPRD